MVDRRWVAREVCHCSEIVVVEEEAISTSTWSLSDVLPGMVVLKGFGCPYPEFRRNSSLSLPEKR
jgi:hypothetical protein